MKPCSPLKIGFQQTTRRYIPDDRTLHNHRRETLRSYNDWNVYDFIIASDSNTASLFRIAEEGYWITGALFSWKFCGLYIENLILWNTETLRYAHLGFEVDLPTNSHPAPYKNTHVLCKQQGSGISHGSR
jgi:hypothetical protein